MKNLLIILFVAGILTPCVAQKNPVRMGYYNRDTILRMTTEYQKVQDSVNNYKANIEKTLNQMMLEYEAKAQKLKQDSASLTPEIYSLRAKQLTDLEEKFNAFAFSAQEDCKILDSILTAPVITKIDDAAKRAGKNAGCKETYEEAEAKQRAAVEGANYKLEDITDMVIKELKLSGTIPKRR